MYRFIHDGLGDLNLVKKKFIDAIDSVENVSQSGAIDSVKYPESFDLAAIYGA